MYKILKYIWTNKKYAEFNDKKRNDCGIPVLSILTNLVSRKIHDDVKWESTNSNIDFKWEFSKLAPKKYLTFTLPM